MAIRNGINKACGCCLPRATTPRYRSAHVWRGVFRPPRGLQLALHPISSTNVTGLHAAAKVQSRLGIQYQRNQIKIPTVSYTHCVSLLPIRLREVGGPVSLEQDDAYYLMSNGHLAPKSPDHVLYLLSEP